MFAGLRRIGPRRTAIVMTLEAVFAIVLAALFLGEGIGPLQLAGGTAILAATILTGLERDTPIEA
jgi:drug/metabolite transporter (DMT)-like permease